MTEDKDRSDPTSGGGHAPEAIAVLLAGLGLFALVGGNPPEGRVLAAVVGTAALGVGLVVGKLVPRWRWVVATGFALAAVVLIRVVGPDVSEPPDHQPTPTSDCLMPSPEAAGVYVG